MGYRLCRKCLYLPVHISYPPLSGKDMANAHPFSQPLSKAATQRSPAGEVEQDGLTSLGSIIQKGFGCVIQALCLHRTRCDAVKVIPLVWASSALVCLLKSKVQCGPHPGGSGSKAPQAGIGLRLQDQHPLVTDWAGICRFSMSQAKLLCCRKPPEQAVLSLIHI